LPEDGRVGCRLHEVTKLREELARSLDKRRDSFILLGDRLEDAVKKLQS
jgi:hypothetical protein